MGLANILAASTLTSICFYQHNTWQAKRTTDYWDWTYLSSTHTFRWLFGRSSYLIVLLIVIVVVLLLRVICSFIVNSHWLIIITTCYMRIASVTVTVVAIFISCTLPSGRISSPWTASHQISNPAHNACYISTACQ